MHILTDRIAHTAAFVSPVVELPRSYVSLLMVIWLRTHIYIYIYIYIYILNIQIIREETRCRHIEGY